MKSLTLRLVRALILKTMTTFSQIYSGSHSFSEGMIEIENLTPNLTKAYIVVNTIDLQENLGQPLLLGFLYQDDGAKRSRPYPIVCQRQTISLDLSTCDTFLFVPTNHLIDQYSLSLWVSSESSGGNASVDLTGYALTSQLPDLTNYALKSEIPTVPSLAGYALTSQLPDLTNYALKSEIPTLTSFNALDSRVGSLESSLVSGLANTQNFISLSANQTLERNKNYFANTSGLVCALPSAPSVGDIVNLATGNYTFRVNHGNGSQLILNLSTQSTVGAGNGIILKAYSAVQLMFIGSNTWITNFRSRTIDNWLNPVIESNSTVKPYTVSTLETYTYYDTPYTHLALNDGDLSNKGMLKTGGGTADECRLLLTFASPTILTSFNYWLGQFNGALNLPTSVDVYIGNSVSAPNLIDSFAFPNTTGSRSIDSNQSQTYVFNFKRSGSNNISVLELQAFGKQVIGGAIAAV